MLGRTVACPGHITHVSGVGQEMAGGWAGMASVHSGGVKGPLHRHSRRDVVRLKNGAAGKGLTRHCCECVCLTERV